MTDYHSIEEAKERLEQEDDLQDVEVQERHDCDFNTHLVLSEDLREDHDGYVLLCPGCLSNVRTA
jgi:hypothetical protein